MSLTFAVNASGGFLEDRGSNVPPLRQDETAAKDGRKKNGRKDDRRRKKRELPIGTAAEKDQ